MRNKTSIRMKPWLTGALVGTGVIWAAGFFLKQPMIGMAAGLLMGVALFTWAMLVWGRAGVKGKACKPAKKRGPPRSVEATYCRWGMVLGMMLVDLCVFAKPEALILWPAFLCAKRGPTVREGAETWERAILIILPALCVAFLLFPVIRDIVNPTSPPTPPWWVVFVGAGEIAMALAADPLARRWFPMRDRASLRRQSAQGKGRRHTA